MEKLKKFFESRALHVIVYVIFAIAIVLFVFQAGILIGYKKAFFSCRLGENYNRDIEGHEGSDGMLPDFNSLNNNLPNANGASGYIIKMSLPNIIIADKDGVEKTVSITDNTIFREFRNDIKSSEIKTGDYVIVIGSPDNNGNIEANLIRVLPPPPSQSNPTTSTSSPQTPPLPSQGPNNQ